MKTITTIIFATTILLAGCKKCYECDNANQAETVCKGDPRFDQIKQGNTITDDVGNPYQCH